MLQTQHFLFPNPLFPLLHSSPISLQRPTSVTLLAARAHNLRSRPKGPWSAQAAEEEVGPVELPSSIPSIFATSDDPTPLQTATSLLLTGAISVFLFRSLRRRAKRAKELKLRSSGAKKSLREEAIESLKAITSTPVGAKSPPSAAQALLGGLSAGVIALILYKFATTVESTLGRQALSDNFSVRQITITIRTIVNGICYLATFVFGINSIGLFLYSGQLAINSIMGDSIDEETKRKNEGQLTSTNTSAMSPPENTESNIRSEDQSSDSRK